MCLPHHSCIRRLWASLKGVTCHSFQVSCVTNMLCVFQESMALSWADLSWAELIWVEIDWASMLEELNWSVSWVAANRVMSQVAPIWCWVIACLVPPPLATRIPEYQTAYKNRQISLTMDCLCFCHRQGMVLGQPIVICLAEVQVELACYCCPTPSSSYTNAAASRRKRHLPAHQISNFDRLSVWSCNCQQHSWHGGKRKLQSSIHGTMCWVNANI